MVGRRGEGEKQGRQRNGETDRRRNEKDCSRAKILHHLLRLSEFKMEFLYLPLKSSDTEPRTLCTSGFTQQPLPAALRAHTQAHARQR